MGLCKKPQKIFEKSEVKKLMSKLIEGKIECPFYIKEGEYFIRCEGVLKNTECVHRFVSNAEKKRYEETVCSCFGGRNCPHHRAVAVLYERNVRI